MKKLFTLLLALVATTALWAYDFIVGHIYYNILTDKTNEVEVTSGSRHGEYSGSVTIPSTVTYSGKTYSVTSIGSSAFSSYTSLTSVTIPNSVTSIGEAAFQGCSRLKSVTIPNSVTSIGYGAFWDCGLTSIVVEDGNTVYDSRENCNAIIETNSNTLVAGCENTTIPNSVTSIGEAAFSGCSGLTSITIPNSVTSIGGWAFYECSGLTSVTIPNSVTSIGDGPFYGCSGLRSVVWNAENCANFSYYSYSYSSDAPFYDIRSQITSFTFGEDVKHIPAYLCYGMSKLTSITIPNSVTSIGGWAFYECSGLTSVTIPNSVTSIGDGPFYGCSGLRSVVWNAENCANFSYYSYSYSSDAPFYDIRSQITSFTFGEDVKHIPAYLCYGMSKLTSITIPNSVTSIGYWAFLGCYGLTSVNVWAEVPPTLYSSVFPDDVSASIPVYVPCGSAYAYQSANVWNKFTNIQELLVIYSIEVGVNDSIMGTSRVDYNTCSEGAQITAIPNYGYHFVQWSDGNTDNPRHFILTQDTTFSAEFAQTFSGQCGDNLYWSYQNNTLTISGFGGMYDNRPWGLFTNEIQTVVLPNGITHIGNDAFSDCTGLNEITIPYTVTSIGDYAFAGCTKLYDIYCFAMEPPTAYESSFANYNAFLHVPCDNQRVYLLDVIFGNFKFIECIEAETTPTDTVVVTPSFNDAEFIWPSNSSADSYTLAISKDGEVFCTLTFNANGQLTGIAFAPSRNGQHNAPAAAQTANGFAFTVTGLDEGSNYTYDLLIQDRSGNTLQSYSGEFRTQSTNDRTVTVEYDAAQGQVTGAGTYLVGDTVTLTATPNDGYRFVRWSNEVVDNPYTFVITENITLSAEFEKVIATSIEHTHSQSPMTDCQKIIHNGQLLILRDGKIYTVMGQEL